MTFKKIFLIGFVFLILGGLYGYARFSFMTKPALEQTSNLITVKKNLAQQLANVQKNAEAVLNEEKTEEEAIIQKTAPKTIHLNVPFTVQAPFANWDIHKESCEEASVLMVDYYLQGIKDLSPETADIEIRKMKDWQVENLGSEPDLYREDYVNFVEKYFVDKKYKVRMLQGVTVEDLKKELIAGNPVIIPATAKLLKNPWYHEQDYHMLVVIGYIESQKTIITNDPGTKRGQNWAYDYNTIETVLKDQKGVAFIVEKYEIKKESRK